MSPPVSSSPLPQANNAPAAAPGRDGIIALTLLMIAGFVVILNETIMGVAIPHLMVDLEITAGTAQWLTTAFLLTMAVVIPTTGYLLRRYTTRAVFVAAMSLFCMGTVICGTAFGIELLIGGRIVQALGTALMLPLLMTTAVSVVAPQNRGKVMGLISVVIAVAPALGPTLSGLILATLGWRWLFWAVLPVGLLALAVGWRWMVNVGKTEKSRLDVPSVVLAAIGFGGIVYGLNSIGEDSHGAGPAPLLMALVAGVLGLVLFVVRQLHLQRRGTPLLDMRVLLHRNLSLAAAILLISAIGMFGTIILVPMYLQNVLGLTSLQAGLALLPGGLATGLLAPVVGSLYDRFGPLGLVIVGTVLATASLWSMSLWSAETSVAWVITCHVAFSLALSAVMTPSLTVSLGSLPPELYSSGSAAVNTVQQVGGAAGTALYVAVMSAVAVGASGRGSVGTEATMAGISAAFTLGSVVAATAVILAAFLRRPSIDPRAAAAVSAGTH